MKICIGWELPVSETTFQETLDVALNNLSTLDFLQIATWNDFGEGTMIEPTEEYGFMYLQLLQEYTGVQSSPEDLQIALELYKARKKYKDNPRVQRLLDRCYQYMKDLRMRRVDIIIKAINRYL